MAAIFFSVAYAAQGYTNPLGTEIKTLLDLVKAVADAIFILTLPFATLAIIILGVQFVMASGNPGKIEDVKKKFLWVLIGTALLVGASLLAQVTVDYIQHGSGA